MNLKIIIIIIFCWTTSCLGQQQNLNYEVYLKDELIGKMKVQKITQKDHETYFIDSDLLVQKLLDIHIVYKITAEFHHGKLVNSTALQIINNKKQVDTQTKWNGSFYVVRTLKGGNRLKEKLIDYNICKLYFQEPSKQTVWSDSFGKFLVIKPLKNGSYKLFLPDDKATFYTYANGICSSVEMELMFTQVKFKLKK